MPEHRSDANAVDLDQPRTPPPGDGTKPAGRIAFGDFEIVLHTRMLLRRGAPVAVGGRAFDVLATLAQAPGRVVSKAELIRRAWPSTFVEETNLRAQLRLLRQGLGSEQWRVKTVTGRGYLLSLAPLPGAGFPNEADGPVTASTVVSYVVIATARHGETWRRLLSLASRGTDQSAALESDLRDPVLAGPCRPNDWTPVRIIAPTPPPLHGAAKPGHLFTALADCLKASTAENHPFKAEHRAADAISPSGSSLEFQALVMVWRGTQAPQERRLQPDVTLEAPARQTLDGRSPAIARPEAKHRASTLPKFTRRNSTQDYIEPVAQGLADIPSPACPSRCS